MQMRARWACPDLGKPKPDGYQMPVPGSSEEWWDCPAYYLRTPQMGLPAEHLVDGILHPAGLVSRRAHEVKVGAISGDDLSHRMSELVNVYLREDAAREQYDIDHKPKGGKH